MLRHVEKIYPPEPSTYVHKQRFAVMFDISMMFCANVCCLQRLDTYALSGKLVDSVEQQLCAMTNKRMTYTFIALALRERY